jgi:2-polyprenyl-3-methyl-5-hydroxy-6-metoxy-1,4-benzoquinol methylase
MNDLKEKIIQLNDKEPWNHLYEINGIKTISNQKFSIGNNNIKWNRIIDKCNFNNKKVLDLACADGYFSIQALLNGASYVNGIDLDKLRIEKAQFVKDHYKYKNIEFNIEDVYNIDFTEEKYDIIMCLGLLHRIPDMEKLLNKLKKESNILIIETKILDTNEEKIIKKDGKTKGNKYNCLYNISSFKYLENILRKNGYTNFIFEIDKRDKNKYKRGLIICN